MTLYKEDLDKMECPCGCGSREIYLYGHCHPQNGRTWASYEKGILTIRCAICDTMIAEIAVAEKGAEA